MKRLLTIGALTALALLLCLELALRAGGYSAPAWHQPDPTLGWVLRPGMSGWYSEEGRSFVTVNAAGQRDRNRAIAKPEGVYRIAVLGDAYSEAMHVALEDTYWALLGERLERCGLQPGKRVEVLNFGVRGYGTAQAYVTLYTRALRYQPDLVLLQFTNGSDVRDNSLALDPVRLRPFFTADAQGRLRLDDSFTASPAYLKRASFTNRLYRQLADHSRLLESVRDVASTLRIVGRAHAGSPPGEMGLEPDVLAPPREAAWQEAWRVTESLLVAMRELAARNGAKMAVFTVPYAVAVHPNAALRAAVQAKYEGADLAYPDRRVASFARLNGMTGITLLDDMRELALRTGRPLYGFDNLQPGFSHWNQLGHRAAADIIARALCAPAS